MPRAPTSVSELSEIHARQQQAFAANSYPSLEERLERLRGLRRVCATVRQGIAKALAEDFGSHDPSIGLLWELGGVLGRIRYTSERLEGWMKPVERECDPTFGDARCYVRYQPKGVVGNMAPWNFPADISLGPLVDILAAGNRAVVKPSECAPSSAELDHPPAVGRDAREHRADDRRSGVMAPARHQTSHRSVGASSALFEH